MTIENQIEDLKKEIENWIKEQNHYYVFTTHIKPKLDELLEKLDKMKKSSLCVNCRKSSISFFCTECVKELKEKRIGLDSK